MLFHPPLSKSDAIFWWMVQDFSALHDFSSWSLYHILVKSDFWFTFKIFQKLNIKDTQSPWFLAQKWVFLHFVNFFFNRPSFFFMNSNPTWNYLYFGVYKSYVAQFLKKLKRGHIHVGLLGTFYWRRSHLLTDIENLHIKQTAKDPSIHLAFSLHLMVLIIWCI